MKSMKTIKKLQVAMLVAFVAMGADTAMAFGPRAGGNAGHSFCTAPGAIVSHLPYENLSEEEETGLLKMREEEKLARDVYTYLYSLWQDQVFSRISKSEQRHMDAIKALLDKYGLADPIEGQGPGQFISPEMQDLYNTLANKGATSLEQALLVGATIEDLDIKDLETLMKTADNEDILTVYQNLAKGSRNHLRAFGAALAAMGFNYEAQFLSQEEVDAIINSPRERGRLDKDGNQVSGPRRTSGNANGNGPGASAMDGMSNYIDVNKDGICDNLQI